MPPTSSTRRALVARNAEVMRDFMAHAVLFQDAVARSAGLNSTDLQTVGLLLSGGPATPGELAARTGLTAGGAITAVVDRLERAGFVSRSRDPDDRRRVLVTADADAIAAAVGPAYAGVTERWGAVLESLSNDELAFANDLLARAADVNRGEVERMRAR
ncbi:putative HTH-type transcriptional regulator YcgE [Agromyces luteolus]|uniref:MarR family transcriptional regulator n=1 Tax=Agromyces luteolus TaxID=88373 RepID=A0A7C9LV92_9MICO|nr:MarR family transcriptional regulator [Agromyces luteolus]MUN08996.1 MarR family transcriptional regulator [Agromyces luteolus]GLK28684.1 putative HTH-type transcriptional regulator YcgE [Agromyces luteolus]